MNSHSVLISAVGGNVGQGVLKALKEGKRAFRTVGIDMERLSAGFLMADSWYQVPQAGDFGFLDRLGEIIQRERIEAIYICSPAELEFFSAHKDYIEESYGVTVLVNPAEVVRVGSDKLATAEFLRDAGFSYPYTVMATDRVGVDAIIRRHGFPLIAKPRKGASSRNVFTVDTFAQLDAVARCFPDLVVQEFLPNAQEEFTASTLSGMDRKVRAIIVLHRDLIQGTTYRTELVRDESLNGHLMQIVECLGAIGPCNLQFRMRERKPVIFEFNPRFSGSAGIRYRYGFNDPEMAFELLRLGLEVRQPYLSPAVVLRFWEELAIPGSTFSELRQPAATNVHLSFPKAS